MNHCPLWLISIRYVKVEEADEASSFYQLLTIGFAENFSGGDGHFVHRPAQCFQLAGREGGEEPDASEVDVFRSRGHARGR